MVIKQGISTTDEGRGALSSSYDVMVKLGQVPAGIMWGALFTAFANAKPGTFLGQIGPTPFPPLLPRDSPIHRLSSDGAQKML